MVATQLENFLDSWHYVITPLSVQYSKSVRTATATGPYHFFSPKLLYYKYYINYIDSSLSSGPSPLCAFSRPENTRPLKRAQLADYAGGLNAANVLIIRITFRCPLGVHARHIFAENNLEFRARVACSMLLVRTHSQSLVALSASLPSWSFTPSELLLQYPSCISTFSFLFCVCCVQERLPVTIAFLHQPITTGDKKGETVSVVFLGYKEHRSLDETNQGGIGTIVRVWVHVQTTKSGDK